MNTTAYILCPELKNKDSLRTTTARLSEAVGLARAISLNVVGSNSIVVREIKSSTYIGQGSVDSFLPIFEQSHVDLVVMDCALTPVQQRNLERIWKVKVIDRTALILEIFGERARTKEGVLQVKLAHLSYQRSRLVHSWTHLERQRGGSGFLGGPGETQIEMDRRIIDDKIMHLKKELNQVKKTRALHRKARKKVPYSIVALVGYTNAGKSTLFNCLTKAHVKAKDQLFATLDPTMREIKLPSGRHVILSDTVGFISELPHELVAAFHATLEEVLEADIVLHVRDCAHFDTKAQKQDVETVLASIGLKKQVDIGLNEVFNKIDLLSVSEKQALMCSSIKNNLVWPVSAITGEGIEALLQHLDSLLMSFWQKFKVRIPIDRGDILAKIYEKGMVLRQSVTEKTLEITFAMSYAFFQQFVQLYPDLVFIFLDNSEDPISNK